MQTNNNNKTNNNSNNYNIRKGPPEVPGIWGSRACGAGSLPHRPAANMA